MNDSVEFSINEDTFKKILDIKNKMGFKEKGWDDWFRQFLQEKFHDEEQNEMEKIMQKVYYDRFYEDWVKNFSLNLNNICNENSARDLDPIKNQLNSGNSISSLVIGRGPSIKKFNHLELLANSNYKGAIVCCDGALINALKAGVTPERFPEFYVVTVDADVIITKYYDDPIVDKYGSNINGIFSTVVNPVTVERARKSGIKIHWLHALFDYNEGRKSFNQISALMVRAKKHLNGLPAIQTGGNVGTSSWFISWQILRKSMVGLIGINHSWDVDDSWDLITSHFKIPPEMNDDKISQKLFPKIFNPEFNCECVLDPIFLYYSSALKDFISRSPQSITTINATEGGCIFGERIKCMKFSDFLKMN